MENTADASMAWFGPAHLDEGWAPAPRYLLRRARVLHHMRNRPPGEILEIGSASGALLSEFAARGFRCTGLESSANAIALARRVNNVGAVTFQERCDASWPDKFDYCFSFEVLEHIENDAAALTEWAAWLRPGGCMMLSVPAHPRLWNARDVWAGHFRRYRKKDLEQVFAGAGLEIETIECYGFPLANVLELLFAPGFKRTLAQGDQLESAVNKAAQTAASGIERAKDVRMFRHYTRAPGGWIMRAMMVAQTLFLQTGLGNGYFVVARRPAKS